MKKYAATAALALTLSLTACAGGAESADTSAPAAETSTPTPTAEAAVEHIGDTWTFEYMGATGTFTLTGNEADPQVQAIEAARQTVDGAPVTVIPVEIDNTNGQTSLNMYGLTVVTMDGEQISSVDLADSFSAWRDAAGEDIEKYNALVDAGNEYGLVELQPGAKGTALVAFAEPLESAKVVYVQPAGGMDQVEATAG